MKTYNYFLILALSLLCSLPSKAQDIHFSQFYESPLNLNPAMTGVMNCNTRFIANFRNQWASVLGANAYNTYSVSYDKKLAVGRTDYFGIGGSLWGDVAGESRFGSTSGRFSMSYSKKMGGQRRTSHYMVLGADAALNQRRIKPGDLRWPTQITANGFDPTLPSNEIINDYDFLFADISAGALWFSVLDEGTNFYIGAAITHLNQPNVSFFDDEVSLFTRTTIHAGGQFPIANKISLLPYGIVMMQGKQREINIGTSVRFKLGPSRLSEQSWQIGGWYRIANQEEGLISDAMIFSTRFSYEQFGVGFSYDLNVSELRAGGAGNGAFELSLSYVICGPENRGVYCPRF